MLRPRRGRWRTSSWPLMTWSATWKRWGTSTTSRSSGRPSRRVSRLMMMTGEQPGQSFSQLTPDQVDLNLAVSTSSVWQKSSTIRLLQSEIEKRERGDLVKCATAGVSLHRCVCAQKRDIAFLVDIVIECPQKKSLALASRTELRASKWLLRLVWLFQENHSQKLQVTFVWLTIRASSK